MKVSRGWAVWLRARRGNDDSGPLGWGWFGVGRGFDAMRPDGACQSAVFRTRRLAREAVMRSHPRGTWSGDNCAFSVRRVRVSIEEVK